MLKQNKHEIEMWEEMMKEIEQISRMSDMVRRHRQMMYLLPSEVEKLK